MPRWDPDAKDRLVDSAVRLFQERGYDAVTINDIAERAGLTRRSFFRHFPDKREVLFAGSPEKTPQIAGMVRSLAADVSAREAVLLTLTEVGEYLTRDPAAQARRQDLIDSSSELQERERTKLAAMAVALSDGLVDRGLSAADARVLGGVASELFRSAYIQAIRQDQPTPFAEHLRASLDRVTHLLTV